MTYFNNICRIVLIGLLATWLTACGGGGGEAPVVAAAPRLPSANNVLSVSVNSGLMGNSVNLMYASVTICLPGSTTQCQTVDNIMVDTGSTGLRLLSSALSPSINLDRRLGAGGLPLLNCVQFIDHSYAWGPVALADVTLGGKTASHVPIQLIADAPYSRLDTPCSSSGTATALDTTATLGANGILGLGLLKEDCGAACAVNAANGVYFICTNENCTATTGTTVSQSTQIKNPITLFASDNNGLSVDLPAVPNTGTTGLSGVVIFGIGTQANNQRVPSTVLTTNANGYITTLLAGKSLMSSFIDSGSNGLYFDSRTIPLCTGSRAGPGFYCPNNDLSMMATLVGANAVTAPIAFSISNASALLNSPWRAALPTLSGPIGSQDVFDWGLPFFYGRHVFIGIEQQTSHLGTGPFYAF
jgi:hypothetical protein